MEVSLNRTSKKWMVYDGNDIQKWMIWLRKILWIDGVQYTIMGQQVDDMEDILEIYWRYMGGVP